VFWGLVGVGIGAVVGVAVVRWAQKTKEKYSASNIAREAGSVATEFSERVRRAVDIGRQEMAEREIELRKERGLPTA